MSTSLPRRTALRSAAAALVVVTCGASTSCSLPGGEDADRGGGSPAGGGAGRDDGASDRDLLAPRTAGATAVDPSTATPDALTAAASRALLERADTVVVTSADPGDVREAGAAAHHLGIPLLVAGPALAPELDRLGTRTVLRYAKHSPAAPSATAVPREFGEREVVEGTPVEDLPTLPGLPRRPAGRPSTVLLLAGTTLPVTLAPLVHAVGGDPVVVPTPDPRASAAACEALKAHPDAAVLAVGPGFGADDVLGRRVRTARRAPELPGGGLLPFPGRMMVALYGHPQTAALGMLGEQSPTEAVARATKLAKEYAALTHLPVVPAFELIATVASVEPQGGSYSSRTSIARLLPWVEAAERAGVYVVLDLQPGRTDFLTQAKAYEELLRRPWVGLALDPEWRLREDQVHLRQIGSVGIDEVNAVGAWLADLVRRHDLPPKVLTLHQFNLRMIRERERLDTSLDEVQWLLHADGQGSQGEKQSTWRALRRDLPEGVWLGWKNFEHEDRPMLTVKETMAKVKPTPSFVSYQ